jgi:hypothetical protein
MLQTRLISIVTMSAMVLALAVPGCQEAPALVSSICSQAVLAGAQRACTAPSGDGQGSGAHMDDVEALQILEGDLETYLSSIKYGREGDGRWQLPSTDDLEVLRNTLADLLTGTINQAAQSASAAGFLLIQFRDPRRGWFYLLRDVPGADNVSPGGTYVWNPTARFPTVIEVPHPLQDAYTSKQGIELYLASRALLLSLSGTHPGSDLVQSTCDGAVTRDYRRSDPSHSVQHAFHVVHQVAEDVLNDPLFVQLHGVGSEGLRELQEECGYHPPPGALGLLVNVSEGLRPAGDDSGIPAADSFSSRLVDAVNADGTIRACLYNRDTSSYGGTWNTQGRYTNGSPDACTRYAPASSGRFIHLEQSNDLRKHHRARMNELITRTLTSYFGQ